jgi:glycosyltransferase involved in cell wall biosynthesis
LLWSTNNLQKLLYFFIQQLQYFAMQTLAILIPAFNESLRLPHTLELIKLSKSKGIFEPFALTEVWIIDDGSTDSTSEVAHRFQAELPELRVLTLPQNQGKGGAIHEGLLKVQAEWCLIADADSATPWDQFQVLLRASSTSGSMTADLAMGSRDLPGSIRSQRQSSIRENLGRLFNLAVRWTTGLPFKDTQCGFKLVRMNAIRPWVPLLQVRRFAWDVELLLFAKRAGLKILEVPVIWEHKEGSRIHPLKDGIEMFLRVLQMRLRMAMLPDLK